jgi:hypothetical protein
MFGLPSGSNAFSNLPVQTDAFSFTPSVFDRECRDLVRFTERRTALRHSPLRVHSKSVRSGRLRQERKSLSVPGRTLEPSSED